jgi:hypothetical protein
MPRRSELRRGMRACGRPSRLDDAGVIIDQIGLLHGFHQIGGVPSSRQAHRRCRPNSARESWPPQTDSSRSPLPLRIRQMRHLRVEEQGRRIVLCAARGARRRSLPPDTTAGFIRQRVVVSRGILRLTALSSTANTRPGIARPGRGSTGSAVAISKGIAN